MVRFVVPRLFGVALAVLCMAASLLHAGTKVRIATQIGNIDLELYDEDKPVTVANFLNYVNAGRYEGTFLHRLISNFIVQGGGYGFSSTNQIVHNTAFPPIVNEYAVGTTYSNTIGTIAMAKVPAFEDDGVTPIKGGGPDSATAEWFLNLGDNSANLDHQNGGFTVFGHVISGLEILTRFNTTFKDADKRVDGIFNVAGFSTLPAIASTTDTDVLIKDLLFISVFILPDPVPAVAPTIAIKGPATIKAKGASATIAGTASSSVTNIEWRIGSKGAFRRGAAGASWKLKVTGLKAGTNLVYLRGVDATGTPSPQRKVKVVRK